MIPKLGRLELVDLRSAWPDEALSFTPWLARPENIELLGREIGIELDVEGTEISVGSFAADIVAKDFLGNRILIENQLEATDHRHLGQCLTYAAGLQAKTIIWIARKLRDEHKAAIDWLNTHTHEDIAFFGIEIEVYRIGESDLAPRFSLVARPNSWARDVDRRVRQNNAELTDKHRENIAYWTALIAASEGRYDALARREPFKGRWQTAETRKLSPDLEIAVNATRASTGLRAELYLAYDDAQRAFDFLREDDETLAMLSPYTVDWERMNRDCRIAIYEHRQPAGPIADDHKRNVWLVSAMKALADVLHARHDAILEHVTATEPDHENGELED